MGATSSDVPGTYDLTIQVNGGGNTTGFLLNDAVESSLPFRTHKAVYSYTPTFLERQNIQGDFGDNQQSFFMTATQRDWSEGEQQRYFRQNDGESARRFWQGSAIDVVGIPGQVSLRNTVVTGTAASAPLVIGTIAANVVISTTTNVYTVDTNGGINDQGAHGLGAAPTGIAGDEKMLYITTTGIGTVGVRKWTGAAFSTFSATPATTLALLNNTLYCYRNNTSNGDLGRYDSAGTFSTLFTWKSGDGTALLQTSRLKAFGGKLLILRDLGSGGQAPPSELWVYDGTGTSKVAEFQPNFQPGDMCATAGTVYVPGMLVEGAVYRPAIFYYANGNIGLLWKATSTVSGSAIGGIANFADGFVFNDPSQNKLLFYSPSLGGVHPVASWATLSANEHFVSGGSGSGRIDAINGTTTVQIWPSATTVASGSITTSLFDFDSSLTKLFRGVTVEFDSATDGNGGTVDVAYRVGDVVGTYTTLATGVTSGSETTLSGVNGRSISIKVTLNKGTSTLGPTLKKIFVRAAPILTRYKNREYILACIGNPGTEDKMRLRDEGTHPLSGRQQVDQLVLAAESIVSAPGKYCTFTDRFGSYDGVIETLEIYETHPSTNADASKSGSFQCKVVTREI